jgi:hypothetical protein
MFIKTLALLAYLGMIVVNILANALPINNLSTGEISELYPNLFTPIGLTFSIWGLIYLLLALYVLYQFGFFQEDKNRSNEDLFKKLGIYFIITSIANMAWIYSWHYTLIGLSLLIMIALLVFLIKIADLLNKQKFSLKDKFFVRLPFTIYFGWITVATIANVTAFLVSLNWDGFGIPEHVWVVLILLIGTIIGILRMTKDKSIAYGLVFVWAYIGILIKHTSAIGFAGEYGGIIMTVILCIFAFLLFGFLVLFKERKILKNII